MKESLAKKTFEAWWSIHGSINKDKELAWSAFKVGIKLAETYNKD